MNAVTCVKSCFMQGIQFPTITGDIVLPIVVKHHSICIGLKQQGIEIFFALP